MNRYTTITRLVFSSPEPASQFVHFLDRAEAEMSDNDFGPGWLGNILSLFGCLNVGFCECNGVVVGLEVVESNIIEVTTESARSPQIGPIIFLALLVDKIATVYYIAYDDNGTIRTNRNGIEGYHEGLDVFFPQNNLLSMIEWCEGHYLK